MARLMQIISGAPVDSMTHSLLHNIINQIKRLRISEEGVAFIEFAIAVPIIILLFVGGTEIARALIINQRLEKTAASLGDAASQLDVRTLSPSGTSAATAQANFLAYMDASYQASIGMMGMYGASGVVLTDLSNPTGAGVQANWHCMSATNSGNLGNGNSITRVVISGNNVVVNGVTLTLNAGEEIITSEAFYDYTPILVNNFIKPYLFYAPAIFPLRSSDTVTGNITGVESGTYARCNIGL